MASFTSNELRGFAREHNSMCNIKVSQKKAPLHEELKKKGVKMAQNKAHKGWVPTPTGKFKKKKAVKTAVKKKDREEDWPVHQDWWQEDIHLIAIMRIT